MVVGGGNPAEPFPPRRATTEDDDLARAVTLSLKVDFQLSISSGLWFSKSQ